MSSHRGLISLITLATLSLVGALATGCHNGRIQIQRPSRDMPDNAIVLFDGSDLKHWRAPGPADGEPGWRIAGDWLIARPGAGDILTKENFRDFWLHVEFNLPEPPEGGESAESGGARGNSGVVLQGRYEIQILNSHGEQPHDTGCGAIQQVRAPDQNACLAPGEWQTFNIFFRAARWEGEGDDAVKIENARALVIQNDIVIHDGVEIPEPTPEGAPETPAPGPIVLQEQGSPVRFRNIWIAPLNFGAQARPASEETKGTA